MSSPSREIILFVCPTKLDIHGRLYRTLNYLQMIYFAHNHHSIQRNVILLLKRPSEFLKHKSSCAQNFFFKFNITKGLNKYGKSQTSTSKNLIVNWKCKHFKEKIWKKIPCPLRFRKWDMGEIRKIFHFLCTILLDVYIKIVHNFEGESSKALGGGILTTAWKE